MNRHFSRSVWQSVAVVLLALPVCAQQAAPARDTSPQILDVQGGKIRVVTVASGLFHPWGIAFADANTIPIALKAFMPNRARCCGILPEITSGAK